jgi:tetratricopeptide (TPR) repeat protein
MSAIKLLHSVSKIILLTAIYCQLNAELADPKFDSELILGMEAILFQRFDSADSIAASIIKKSVNNPSGYFLKATSLSARYYDESDTAIVNEIQAVVDEVLELTEKKEFPEMLLYRGAVLAYNSIILAKEDRLIMGAMNAKKSSDVFKKIAEKKINSSDASGMLGGYYYWTSVFIKSFSWLPFFSDKRSEGISLLKTSIPNARYLQSALSNTLVWIYYDNLQYKQALDLCDEVLKQYPTHRLFRQAKMHILFKMNRLKESENIALKLIEEWQGRETVPVNLLNVRIKLAIIYYGMGRRDKANILTPELLEYKKDAYIKMRLNKEFGYLEDAVRKNRMENK